MPNEIDLFLGCLGGPEGAALADRYLQAVIDGLPSGPLRKPPDVTVEPSADPQRYGFRFWALRPDGVLVSPIAGTEALSGNTFEAACGCSPTARCACGVHYIPDVDDFIEYVQSMMGGLLLVESSTLRRLRDRVWPLVVTYGVAVGRVETDTAAYVHKPFKRAPRWHMLAAIVAGLSSTRRAQLEQRYGCEVVNASVQTCQAVERRLVFSLSAAEMADLACRPATGLL